MYLITESYFKSRVSVALQKDASELKVAFENVTDFYLKDLLSIPLFELYLNHVENGSELTSKQSELFDKVKVYFALMASYELMLNLFEITNKGNQTEPNSASLELVKMKRQEVLGKAEQMKANILKYLADNRSDFPQYFASEEANTPQISSNGSPIVFLNEPKIWLG